jgi:hypothetical protein
MRTLPLAAALALSGCAPLLSALAGVPTQAPAPLERFTVDDSALETAWKSFDLALDAINILGDAGVIVPGSPKGKAVASGIRTVNRSLASAERFAAAGSTTDYRKALDEATAGIADLRSAIKGE